MEQEIEIKKENQEQEISIERENVDIGIIPSGTLNIIENGEYDVTNYKNANVQTQGIIPSGQIEFTSNGIYDVTQYASANVNLQQEQNFINTKYNQSTAYSYNTSPKGCDYIERAPMVDISDLSSMSAFYDTWRNLKYIPTLDTSNIANMYRLCRNCNSLVEFPLLDTGKVTNMKEMFNGCSSLTTIPILDTSSATDMASFVLNVSTLNDNSLNNILKMCINATNYGSTKTLYALGLRSSDYQSSKIQNLSNYQDFVSAGWSIGY